MSERAYLALLAHVIDHGDLRPTRATLRSTGQRVDAYTVWAPDRLAFWLGDRFPAVTTKRLAFRQVVAELLWFLSGSTNVRPLQADECNIWDEWADEDGELGPVYGQQWRRFSESSLGGTDQIAQLVADLRAVVADLSHDKARRLLLTSLDPSTVDGAALYPCHVLVQWDVWNGCLSCRVDQRSADLFLGLPFNIASYAVLTHLLAAVVGLNVGTLTFHLGNAHVYANHTDQVREMLCRRPYEPPRLMLPLGVGFGPVDGTDLPMFHGADGRALRVDDLALVGYQHRPELRGEVAV